MRKLLLFLLVVFGSAYADGRNDLGTVVAKVSATILATDSRCHYIIQGARLDQLSWLNSKDECVNWTVFAEYPDHLAALKLYRREVEEAWPDGTKPLDLVRDLAIIDEQCRIYWCGENTILDELPTEPNPVEIFIDRYTAERFLLALNQALEPGDRTHHKKRRWWGWLTR